MSTRENIAKNIEQTLKDMRSPLRLAYVTREPFDFNQLSNAQYPAVLVQTSGETREDATIGDSGIKRMAVVTYQIIAYIKSDEIDRRRNEMIEAIEEILDQDRTRGGYAIDTQIVSIDTDDGAIEPVGGVVVTAEVEYFFTRGAT